MDPTAPAESTYAAALRVLNIEGMAGFNHLVNAGVHRRYDGYPEQMDSSLHHAVIAARRLPWLVKHELLANLVQRGLDLNVVNREGHTPLYKFMETRVVMGDDGDAATAGAIRQMVALGARIVAPPEFSDYAPIELLGVMVGPRTLRVLFEMGADPFVPQSNVGGLLLYPASWAVVEEFRVRQRVNAWASAAQPRLSPSAALSDVAVTDQGASSRVFAMLIGHMLLDRDE